MFSFGHGRLGFILGINVLLVIFNLAAGSCCVLQSLDSITFTPKSWATIAQQSNSYLGPSPPKLPDLPFSETALAVRGGVSLQTNELNGALCFVIFDVVVRKFFSEQKIGIPSQLGGCCILFVALTLAEFARPGWGESAFQWLSPGAGLFAKFLPVFFAPGLAILPLSPFMGSGNEVFKVVAVVVFGFFFSLTSTGLVFHALRKVRGVVTSKYPVNILKPSSPVADAFKPFSPKTKNLLVKSAFFSAAVSVVATRLHLPFATPLRTIAFAFVTAASYVWSSRLPSQFNERVHPLITTTGLTLMATLLIGLSTKSSFYDVLRSYKRGSLNPKTAGAGDFFHYLQGPAVISFAIALYSRKKDIADNLPNVLLSMLVSSLTGTFGIASIIRFTKYSGPFGYILRTTLLSRTVTTTVGKTLSKLTGADMSVASSILVLTGMFSATCGARVLNLMKVTDPLVRGLGIGAAGQGLGTSSLAKDEDAFPFAVVSLILTAVTTTAIVSIPSARNVLLRLATGS